MGGPSKGWWGMWKGEGEKNTETSEGRGRLDHKKNNCHHHGFQGDGVVLGPRPVQLVKPPV